MFHEVAPALELALADADGRAEDVVVDQGDAADAVALDLGVEMPASVRAGLLGLALAGASVAIRLSWPPSFSYLRWRFGTIMSMTVAGCADGVA